MTWRKLEKLMRENPQYFDDSIQIGAAETAQIMVAYPYTFEDMIERAKQKAGLSEEAWSAADRVIAKHTRQKTRKSQRSWTSIHKRLAVVIATFILFAFFFIFSPIGRSIAASAINYIVQFFNTFVLITSDSDGRGLDPDMPQNQLPRSVNSADVQKMHAFRTIEELINETGLIPVYLHTEHVTLESITLFCDGSHEMHTNILYVFPEGSVGLTQFWVVNESVVAQAGKRIGSIMVWENSEMVLYEDEFDHAITAFITLYDSTLMISVEAGVDMEEIAGLLCMDKP